MHMQIILLHIRLRAPILPRFFSRRDFVNHAKTIGLEQNLVYNRNKYEDFVVEVFGSDALKEETPNSDL